MPRCGGSKVPYSSPYKVDKFHKNFPSTAISCREKAMRILKHYGIDYLQIERDFLESGKKRNSFRLSLNGEINSPYVILEDMENIISVTIIYENGRAEKIPYRKVK